MSPSEPCANKRSNGHPSHSLFLIPCSRPPGLSTSPALPCRSRLPLVDDSEPVRLPFHTRLARKGTLRPRACSSTFSLRVAASFQCDFGTSASFERLTHASLFVQISLWLPALASFLPVRTRQLGCGHAFHPTSPTITHTHSDKHLRSQCPSLISLLLLPTNLTNSSNT